MKRILKRKTENKKPHFLRLLFFKSYQPYFLPVPSPSGLLCLPFHFGHYNHIHLALTLHLPSMVVTVGIPPVLEWGGQRLSYLQVGWREGTVCSVWRVLGQREGHSIFWRARKPRVPWAWPVTLFSCELSGSSVTKWQIICGVSPFQRKDLIKPNQQTFRVLYFKRMAFAIHFV